MRSFAPIFGFNNARPDIVQTVTSRVVAATKDPLLALNDAAYHESKRLEGARGREEQAERAEWKQLARALSRMDPAEQKKRLEELCTRYCWDVAGNFNPTVYKVSSRLLPPLVAGLLAPSKLASLAQTPAKLLNIEALDDTIVVEGPIDTIQKLVRHGTVVYVPTHLSNMDSMVFGYAIERAMLPPATYGAGKNLFTNPILSFFMHNLGAYRVDRRIKHNLYKDVLKSYSCVLLERGYHSLFFPGGTRSRSGGVERKLKLGLVGSAAEAYARTLIAGHERRVFFVPATINYPITLEAETLIADYLTEAGKGRFIIEDDESARVGRVTSFIRKLLGMHSPVVIRLSDPVDFFGNRVDDAGDSHDARGRKVDPSSYVRNARGEVTIDTARDAQYTRELADVICDAYLRDTVIMSTHVTAAACFARLAASAPSGDLFSVLRHPDPPVVPRDALAKDVVALRDSLLSMEQQGRIRVGEELRRASGGDIVESAVQALAGYHTAQALIPVPGGIALGDNNLLFYYQNRLAAHGLALDAIAPPGLPSPRGGSRPAVRPAGGAT